MATIKIPVNAESQDIASLKAIVTAAGVTVNNCIKNKNFLKFEIEGTPAQGVQDTITANINAQIFSVAWE